VCGDVNRWVQLKERQCHLQLLRTQNEDKAKDDFHTLIVRPEVFSTAKRLPVVCVQDSDVLALVSQYTSMSNLQFGGTPTRNEQDCSIERRSPDISELNVAVSILNIELFPPASGGWEWIPKRQISRNSPGPDPIVLSVISRDKTTPATSHDSNCARGDNGWVHEFVLA
jgi:hypothetical protein